MITGKAELKERVRSWAEKLDARVTSISVRPMTTKWEVGIVLNHRPARIWASTSIWKVNCAR